MQLTPLFLQKKDQLLEKLRQSNLDIFWTVLGEKNIIGLGFGNHDFLGRLEVSGVGYFENQKWVYHQNYNSVGKNGKNRQSKKS